MFELNQVSFSEENVNSVELSLNNTYEQLMLFSKSENFVSQMTQIFGENITSEQLVSVRDMWTLGNFSTFPTIEFLPENIIGSAKGAFSENTNEIYLSSELVTKKLQH